MSDISASLTWPVPLLPEMAAIPVVDMGEPDMRKRGMKHLKRWVIRETEITFPRGNIGGGGMETCAPFPRRSVAGVETLNNQNVNLCICDTLYSISLYIKFPTLDFFARAFITWTFLPLTTWSVLEWRALRREVPALKTIKQNPLLFPDRSFFRSTLAISPNCR